LLALLVPPLLVELLLQLGAVVVAFGAAPDRDAGTAGAGAGTPAGDAACAALCVGDSFTYGLGSTAPANSYPMQLESALAARPFRSRSRVVNAGWPGSTSREVLLAVKERLETVDPACVIVLVGVNDVWRAPALLGEDELDRAAAASNETSSGGGFRLEWRTRRLLQLLLQPAEERPTAVLPEQVAPSQLEEPAPVAQDALVGRWRSNEGEMTLHADGTAELDGVAYRWTRRGPSVDFVEAAPGGKTTRTQVMVNERGASFRPFPGTSAPRRFTRVEERGRGPDEAGAGGSDSDASLERIAAEVKKRPTDGRTRLKRIRMAQRAGATEIVAEDVAWFEERAASSPGADVSRELALALSFAGRVEDAGRVANELLGRDPGDRSLWFLVAQAAQARGDVDGALAAADRSLADASETANRPERLRLRSKLHGKKGSPVEAARDTIEAWAIDGRDDNLGREVMLAPQRFGEPQLESIADSLALDAAKRERLRAVVAKSSAGPGSGPIDVLEEHVTRIIDLCSERKVATFLLTYPSPRSKTGTGEELARAQRLLAERTGARLIDVRGHFKRLMQSHEREEYFIADGHCNDAGYAEMARVIADALHEFDAASGK
jgi:lysophospholipase L1-like esterase